MGQQSEITKNHMEIYWHDYASSSTEIPITKADLVEKASVIGRTGLMLLECGTGAWRVRSSMNTFSRALGIMSLTESATWFANATLMIVALPLGLIFARIITDKTFRYCT